MSNWPVSNRSSGTLIPRTTARNERSPTAETAIVLIGFFLIQFPLTLLGLVGLFALSPLVFVEPWTLVTNVYAHASPGHLVGNLLGLILFGALVERVTSRRRFHAFFLLTGMLAGLAEVGAGTVLTVRPRGVLGASGAVFALMGYLITGNRVADGLLRRVDRVTESDRATTVVLISVAVILAILLSGPGSALIGHMTGLVLGLFAGRIRLLHLRTR
ncbi:rhomboid family intramembrane serine protease [Salinigranum marinum]|jgi:membrane associated rhomboid family serine protease|uniref:rhomboid family intramembrane serine protease n=1 Tax=Salinigranum marinum TaxID=1515595 RepID=UPI002989B7BE|nr:rhomboid family intramembrane serine protease [Salinigranum marinum]